MMLTDRQREEVWTALVDGGDLKSLGIGSVGRRLDLTGLFVLAPKEIPGSQGTTKLLDLITISGARWVSIDFSGSSLPSLRFRNCIIEDCVFDSAKCRDWRLWGTTIAQSSFRKTDLRDAAMGGIDGGKRNVYRDVRFLGTDLRGSAHGSADFVGCSFVDAKLAKVDFGGSVFVGGSFTGRLDEVRFNRSAASKDPTLPTNEMRGVDFSHAELRSVEFRCLDMLDVKWPNDDNHLVIHDYRGALDRALHLLSEKSEMEARQLEGYLEICRKWAGENQEIGLLFAPDLIEIGGEVVTQEVIQMLCPQLH